MIPMAAVLIFTGLSVTHGALEQAKVPADGVITISDPGLRNWGPELVRFQIDEKAFARQVLKGPDGVPVPFQVRDGQLAFVAEVPNGESRTWRFGSGSAAPSPLRVSKESGSVVLENPSIAVRLPLGGAQGIGIPAAEAPAPLMGWRLGDQWMGGSRWVEPRRVTAWQGKLIEEGPAVVTWQGEWNFSPSGRYVMRVSLSPGVPIAFVEEEMDLGKDTSGWLLLDVTKGWAPTQIADISGAGEQNLPQVKSVDLKSFIESSIKKSAPPDPLAPRIEPPLPGLERLFSVTVGGQWGGYRGGVVLGEGDLAYPAPGRSLSIVPIHPGWWRRASVWPVWQGKQEGVVIGLPLGVRPLSWATQPGDESSPFSTHEHDPGLPPTLVRRAWTLSTGVDFVYLRAGYGHIGLNRFKDWVVDWPDTAGAKAYPGAFFSKELIARQKASLDSHPAAGELRKSYLITGNPADADAAARRVLAFLRQPYRENDFYVSGLSNYRKSQLLFPVIEAEDALACPELDPALRKELRQRLALYANVLSEPDLNPHGAGLHLGNNNMPINRSLALAFFAGLLPDHPRYDEWMRQIAEYTRFKLATYFGPDGAAIEPPTYQLYAPIPALVAAHVILKNRGVADLSAESDLLYKNLRYLSDISVADNRYPGSRILPGMGNSQNFQSGVWGASQAAFAADPEKMEWLDGMFRESGGRFEPSSSVHSVIHPRFYAPLDRVKKPALTSRFIPSYGIVFRSGQGPDETALLLRAGTHWGHWDTDAGNLLFYSRGVPLSPGTGYQYYGGVGTRNHGVYHNRCKPFRRDLPEPFGMVDGVVLDYALGGNVEYATMDRRYPVELFSGGDSQKEVQSAWRRSLVFLHGKVPYAVVRDSFPGAEDQPKWWTWLNLGGPENATLDGQVFPDVKPETALSESEMPTKEGQSLLLSTAHGGGTQIWFGRSTKLRVAYVMKSTGGASGEIKTAFEALAGPGEDFQFLLRPMVGENAACEVSRPADGVFSVKHEEGNDWILLHDLPQSFQSGDVELSGRASAVRILSDRVVLAVLAGPGTAGYRGLVLKSDGPAEKIIPLKEIRPGELAGTPALPERIEAELPGGWKVLGEGPFTLSSIDGGIAIETDGRERILHFQRPESITRSWLTVDGKPAMAAWNDPPAMGWGKWRNAALGAIAVPAGKHRLEIREWKYPAPFEAAAAKSK